MNAIKIKKMYKLLKMRRFFPIIGLITKKFFGRNFYINYLYNKADSDGHIPYQLDGTTIYLSPGDQGISYQILHHGDWEPQSGSTFFNILEAIRETSNDELTFLDIGANCGYYTLQAAELLGENCRILAVEPVPDNQVALKKAIVHNEFEKRIDLMEVAIGDKRQTKKLQMSHRSNAHTLAKIPDSHKHLYTEKSITVDVVTADGLIKTMNIDPGKIDFVRMDVEGYEWEIFQGMHSILQSASVVFVELHPHRTSHSKLCDILDLLESSNFKIKYASSSQSSNMSSFADVKKHLQNTSDKYATDLIVQK